MNETRCKPLRRPGTTASHNSSKNKVNASSSIAPGSIRNEDDLWPRNNFDGEGSGYLEKEKAYKLLNDELEKRTQEIFQKIEKYSDRAISNRVSEAGDGDASCLVDEDELESSSIGNPYANFFDSDRATTAKSSTKAKSTIEKGCEKSASCESMGSLNSENSRRSQSFCLSSSEKSTVASVDLKARKRLQKATESVVKCLQSKLVSHESRLTDLHLQFRQKIQENTMLESKVKALEEDRERLLKSIGNLQNSAEKFSRSAEIAKSNLNLKMQAFTALKKDIDMLKREQRQKCGQIQNLQTRLNRCVEENDRLKNQTRSLQMNSRERQQEDRCLIEELQQKVSSLEQQKSILNATIGKQSSLIRTLRTQKSAPDRTFY